MICWSCSHIIPVPAAAPEEITESYRIKLNAHVPRSEQVIGCCYCGAAYTIHIYLDRRSQLSPDKLEKLRNVTPAPTVEQPPRQRPFLPMKTPS